MSASSTGATRGQLIAAWIVVYGVWSSTYLAIRIAVMDIPPGLLAGIRFAAAGLLLIGVAMLRGRVHSTTKTRLVGHRRSWASRWSRWAMAR